MLAIVHHDDIVSVGQVMAFQHREIITEIQMLNNAFNGSCFPPQMTHYPRSGRHLVEEKRLSAQRLL